MGFCGHQKGTLPAQDFWAVTDTTDEEIIITDNLVSMFTIIMQVILSYVTVYHWIVPQLQMVAKEHFPVLNNSLSS